MRKALGIVPGARSDEGMFHKYSQTAHLSHALLGWMVTKNKAVLMGLGDTLLSEARRWLLGFT